MGRADDILKRVGLRVNEALHHLEDKTRKYRHDREQDLKLDQALMAISRQYSRGSALTFNWIENLVRGPERDFDKLVAKLKTARSVSDAEQMIRDMVPGMGKTPLKEAYDRERDLYGDGGKKGWMDALKKNPKTEAYSMFEILDGSSKRFPKNLSPRCVSDPEGFLSFAKKHQLMYDRDDSHFLIVKGPASVLIELAKRYVVESPRMTYGPESVFPVTDRSGAWVRF